MTSSISASLSALRLVELFRTMVPISSLKSCTISDMEGSGNTRGKEIAWRGCPEFCAGRATGDQPTPGATVEASGAARQRARHSTSTGCGGSPDWREYAPNIELRRQRLGLHDLVHGDVHFQHFFEHAALPQSWPFLTGC